jgi:hypothetical protein
LPQKITNESGRRIGEDHPRAVLLDHEVDLLMGMLEEREALIRTMESAGYRQVEVDTALTTKGLSYRCLGLTFEVHRSTIYKIAKGRRRCQTAAAWLP